jgi:catechol 2,3-dioxygenase-like lactoylglutathione lyase family enzyme
MDYRPQAGGQDPLIRGIHHVGVSVLDLERASRVYGSALPLEPGRRLTVRDSAETRRLLGLTDEVSAELLISRAPNMYFEFFRFQSPDPGPPRRREASEAGLAHVCIQSRDLQPTRERLESQGVVFTSPPSDLGTGIAYSYGRDPDQNLLETEAVPGTPTDPAAWVGHVAFVTADLERLTGFYSELVGRPVVGGARLPPRPAFDEITGLKGVDLSAAWIPGLNVGLEFWRYHNPPTVAQGAERPVSGLGWTHLCFEVEDVPAAAAHAESLGARLHCPPTENALADVAYARDPDGNVIEFVRWKGSAADLSIDRLPHLDVLERVAAARAEARG